MKVLKSISQNKRPLSDDDVNKTSPQWDYLIKFLSLDLAIWSIYLKTGESCCLKWSFSLTLSEIPWRFSSIFPNVKISLTLCKIPWQFPDLEKFYFSLIFPWRLWTLIYIHIYIYIYHGFEMSRDIYMYIYGFEVALLFGRRLGSICRITVTS